MPSDEGDSRLSTDSTTICAPSKPWRRAAIAWRLNCETRTRDWIFASNITAQPSLLKTQRNERGEIAADSGNVVLLTPVGQPLADLDINCRVDTHDLMMLIDDWQKVDSPADFDGDGTVGYFDLLLLLDHWG